MIDLPCRFGDSSGAIAVWEMDEGCMCYPDDRVQSLCLHHTFRASPRGSMDLLLDLTTNLKVTELMLRAGETY